MSKRIVQISINKPCIFIEFVLLFTSYKTLGPDQFPELVEKPWSRFNVEAITNFVFVVRYTPYLVKRGSSPVCLDPICVVGYLFLYHVTKWKIDKKNLTTIAIY